MAYATDKCWLADKWTAIEQGVIVLWEQQNWRKRNIKHEKQGQRLQWHFSSFLTHVSLQLFVCYSFDLLCGSLMDQQQHEPHNTTRVAHKLLVEDTLYAASIWKKKRAHHRQTSSPWSRATVNVPFLLYYYSTTCFTDLDTFQVSHWLNRPPGGGSLSINLHRLITKDTFFYG